MQNQSAVAEAQNVASEGGRLLWFALPLILVPLLAWLIFAPPSLPHWVQTSDAVYWQFALYVAVGFLAQIIDGAIGMAYGISASTFLMSIGIPPAVASAGVHLAEIFTTGASGLSHFKLGNVDRDLLKRLIVPGVLGAALGALALSSLGDLIKPYIALYLLSMGFVMLWKATKRSQTFKEVKHLSTLGFLGGFLDALGGGGWGPVVNSTLIGNGYNPRYAIGSVNTAEFFVALSGSIVFVVMLQFTAWTVMFGLVVGGLLAAPMGAFLCQRIPHRVLITTVGLIVVLLSLRTVLKTWG